MATIREVESMTVEARGSREHGRIPNEQWHRMVASAEGMFERQQREERAEDRLAAARDLAREMARAAPDRENPFKRDELRQAFDGERAIDRMHDRQAGRADRGQGAAQNGVSTPEFNRAVQDAELTIEARQLANPGSTDPVLQMGMKIPASQQGRVREAAETLAHSDDVTGKSQAQAERAEPGRSYVGQVLDVTDKHVLQQVGDRTIEHDRQALTGRGMSSDRQEMQGKNVEIRYPHGSVGLVREPNQAREIGGQEKALQKDYGGREK